MPIRLAVVACTFATAASPSFGEVPKELADFRAEVYRTVGDIELSLFVKQPATDAAAPRPVVVFFFGGGWKSGTPTQFEPHCRELAEKGVVGITVDYRVLNRHGTAPRDAVADAKAAIRYVRANAKRLGVDPNRIVASGGSAGGHLAAATGIVPGFEPKDAKVDSTPNALALFNPAVMLAPLDGENPLGAEKAKDIAERTGGKPTEISPVHHVRKGLPPTIVFHGTKDTAVPFATIRVFEKRMTEAGNVCEVVAYEGRPHGFFNLRRSKEDYRSTMDHLWRFLRERKYVE